MHTISERQRKIEEDEQTNGSTTNGEPNKVKLEEGFSWWTCIQYDMSLNKTKPQAVAADQQTSKS